MIKKTSSLLFRLGTSTTAKSLYWVFSGNSVAVGLAFFSTVLIARFLSKEEFGLFLALYSFSALLSDLGDMGLGPSLSSFLPPLVQEKKHREVTCTLSTTFYLQFGVGIFLTLGVGLFGEFFNEKLFAGSTLSDFWAALSVMLALMGFNFAILSLSALKYFKETAVINVANGVVRLFLLILFALSGNLSTFSVLVVHFGGFMFSWVFALIYLKLDFLTFQTNRDHIKSLVKFSGFLGVQKIFVAVLARLDVLMLIPLSNAFEAGVYGAASRIALIYPVFIGSLSQVLAPSFAEFRNGRAARKYFIKTLGVTALFAFSLLIFYLHAEPIVTTLFGSKYHDAIPVFKALLIAMIPFVLGTPFTSLVIFTFKKPQIIALASLVQLVIMYLLNLFFIPVEGRMGPVWGIGIGNLAVFLIVGAAAWYYFRIES